MSPSERAHLCAGLEAAPHVVGMQTTAAKLSASSFEGRVLAAFSTSNYINEVGSVMV